MSVARIILWLLAAIVFALFAIPNWTPVPLVFGATEVVIRLPVLILIVVALAWLPMSARFRLARRRWRLQATSTPIAAAPPPLRHPDAVSQAEPTIVPPGCG